MYEKFMVRQFFRRTYDFSYDVRATAARIQTAHKPLYNDAPSADNVKGVELINLRAFIDFCLYTDLEQSLHAFFQRHVLLSEHRAFLGHAM